MSRSEGPSSPNQRKTEPVPPTQAHDVPGVRSARPPAGAGTATTPGPREGSPSIAREGLADGEPDTRAPGTTTF